MQHTKFWLRSTSLRAFVTYSELSSGSVRSRIPPPFLLLRILRHFRVSRCPIHTLLPFCYLRVRSLLDFNQFSWSSDNSLINVAFSAIQYGINWTTPMFCCSFLWDCVFSTFRYHSSKAHSTCLINHVITKLLFCIFFGFSNTFSVHVILSNND